MSTNKINFTKPTLNTLPLPEPGKRATYHDEQSRGLCLIVTPKGTKSFFVLRKVDRKTERILIGRYPDTSIANARKRAGEINSQIDAGSNPNDVKREKRSELTFGEFFKIYMERHANLHTKRPEELQYRFDRYLPSLANRRLSTIRRQDVMNLYHAIAREYGKTTANKSHTVIRAVLNKAIIWEYLKTANPANGLTRFREQSRDRFIKPDEMPHFLEALAQEPNETIRDFLMMLLLTGARRSECQRMAWNEVDLANGVWSIPDTKNGEPRRVVLVGQAQKLLSRRLIHRENDYVFPSTGKAGHLQEPKRAWERLLERANIENLRIHDLRRTHGSWMAAGGTSLSIIGKALGHKDTGTATIYARLDLDPVRKAVESAANAMFGDFSLPGDESEPVSIDTAKKGKIA